MAKRCLGLLVCLIVLSLPGASRAFDKRLAIGAGGGYTQLFRNQATEPTSAFGGGGNAHITFGITDTIGVSIAGGMAWFGSYTPMIPTETVDENGEPITVNVPGPDITELGVWDLALSGVYAIDVSRVTPYFALGAVAARVVERQAGAQVTDLEVGLRVDIGFDYELLKHLTLGALVGMDTLFTGQSQYGSSFHFIVRLSVFWDLGELGREGDSE